MSTELSNPKHSLEELLKSDKFSRKIKAVLSKPGQAERFVQVGLNALIRQPGLRDCSQASIITALLRLSQINLEPDGYHAHLVPFGKQVQLIIDYKGLITIIRRNPNIAVMKGNVIYLKDKLSYKEGSDRVFSHEPTYQAPGPENPVIGAYSFVKYKDGDWDVDIMPTWKIELTRERSRAKDNGPWITDYDEMAIKTVIRHHSKRLPLQPEERDAVRADDDQFEFNPFEHEQHKLPEVIPNFDDEPEPARTESPVSPRSEEPIRRAVQRPQNSRSNKSSDERKVPESPVEAGPKDRGGRAEDGQANPFNDPDPQQSQPAPRPSAPKPAESMVEAVAEKPASKKGETLLAMINRKGFTQAQIIDVLVYHELNVGEAAESGIVADLPEETLDLAIRQWGSVEFSVKQRAGAK